ncbi:MAG: hypothetical protein HYZ75_11705 [Elusimicrobia bacterium]|nr:hypothetical protein [Elusimicrobiota bacterium]
MASVGFDAFYDFVEDPVRSAEAARRRPPLALGITAYALAAAGLYAAQGLAGRNVLLGVSLPALAFVCSWSLGMGALFAAAVHLAAEAAGGRAPALALFSLFGFSRLAWGLALPAMLLLKALAPDAGWAAGAVFAAAGLWVLVLETRSVRLIYGFGHARALAVVLAPYAALATGILLVFAATAWGLVYQFMRLKAA